MNTIMKINNYSNNTYTQNFTCFLKIMNWFLLLYSTCIHLLIVNGIVL